MHLNRILRIGLVAAVALALVVSLAACGPETGLSPLPGVGAVPAASPFGDTQDPGDEAADALTASADSVAPGDLSEAEVEALYWMREEEKLARDVYLAMFDLWGLPVFENIAASEERHMEAVLGLIEAYGLDDPVADDAAGAFTNPELAALYEELTAQGSRSVVAALTVGATIEDLDILDLEELLAEVEHADIVRVFESLKRGSQNHLRAFTSRLEAEGAEYEPVYHSAEEIAALLDETQGGGRGGRGGRSR